MREMRSIAPGSRGDRESEARHADQRTEVQPATPGVTMTTKNVELSFREKLRVKLGREGVVGLRAWLEAGGDKIPDAQQFSGIQLQAGRAIDRLIDGAAPDTLADDLTRAVVAATIGAWSSVTGNAVRFGSRVAPAPLN